MNEINGSGEAVGCPAGLISLSRRFNSGPRQSNVKRKQRELTNAQIGEKVIMAKITRRERLLLIALGVVIVTFGTLCTSIGDWRITIFLCGTLIIVKQVDYLRTTGAMEKTLKEAKENYASKYFVMVYSRGKTNDVSAPILTRDQIRLLERMRSGVKMQTGDETSIIIKKTA